MVTERRRGPASDAFVSVRLTRKHADVIDGVDLSHVGVGDGVRLPSREATLLIAEGWAVPSGNPVTVECRESPIAHDRRAAVRFGTQQRRRSARVRTTPRHDAPQANARWVSGHGDLPSRAIQFPAEQTKI